MKGFGQARFCSDGEIKTCSAVQENCNHTQTLSLPSCVMVNAFAKDAASAVKASVEPVQLMNMAFHIAKIVIPMVIFSSFSTGCAVHYYDKATGTEHLWGFGHFKMAVHPSDEGVTAVIKGTQTLGLGLGLGREDYYLTAGWNNQRFVTVANNASVRLEWPTADFFNVRVGTNFPAADCSTNSKEKK